MQISFGSDDHQALKPKTAKAVKLTLEPFSILAHATADKIGDRFSLDRKQAFETGDRIVSGHQSATLGFEPRKWQWLLLASVDNDHGLCIGQLAKRAECGKLRVCH
ncbi:MAG: hypothetical protein JO025_22970 [Verrucomicrobia bacterium]|nr:hypothetical protein [Verrucomicrobiota bacterium]